MRNPSKYTGYMQDTFFGRKDLIIINPFLVEVNGKQSLMVLFEELRDGYIGVLLRAQNCNQSYCLILIDFVRVYVNVYAWNCWAFKMPVVVCANSGKSNYLYILLYGFFVMPQPETFVKAAASDFVSKHKLDFVTLF